MNNVWEPTRWGRLLCGAPPWSLRLEGTELRLSIQDQVVLTLPVSEPPTVRLRQGVIWGRLRLSGRQFRGLSRRHTRSLKQALNEALALSDALQQLEAFKRDVPALMAWVAAVGQLLFPPPNQTQRWITHAQQAALKQRRPSLSFSVDALNALLSSPAATQVFGDELPTVQSALQAWQADVKQLWTDANAKLLDRLAVVHHPLLQQIAQRPLSEAQVRAVLCFDNRMLLEAPRRSGKTSTLLTKALYALHSGLFDASRIALVTVEPAAAHALHDRLLRRAARLGWDASGIDTSTINALALAVTQQASGQTPYLPPWALDDDAAHFKLARLVEHLKGHAPRFREEWDLFRLVFARHLPAFDQADTPQPTDLLVTLNGERVDSLEACMIANWLFYQGVRYEYARPFEKQTPGSQRVYRPAFYYPEVGLYHEHFALDHAGQALSQQGRYQEEVEWKREIHRYHRTPLIETTSHLLRQGAWMQVLSQTLTHHGLRLKPDPNRPRPAQAPAPLDELALIRLMRGFIRHAKHHKLPPSALRQELNRLEPDGSAARNTLFLNLVGPLMDAWNQALAQEGGVDLEDSLNQAAEHLEQGRCLPPYELILADDIHLASPAQIRLYRALLDAGLRTPQAHWQRLPPPGRHLFATGDMAFTTFEEKLGPAVLLRMD